MKLTTRARRPTAYERLLATARRLHGPGGCPWDRAQTVRSLFPHLVEETWEAFCAQQRRHSRELEDELGDVLYTVMFLAMLAEREGRFTLNGMLTRTRRKMERRHPHVFGVTRAATADEAYGQWQAIKRRERRSGARLPKVREQLVHEWTALYRKLSARSRKASATRRPASVR